MPVQPALAEPTASELKAQAESKRGELSEMQYVLDEASDSYSRVLAEKESAEALEATLQTEIDDTETRIGELQGNISERAREMYKGGSPIDVIGMLLDARSFEELVSTWDYLVNMSRNDAKMITESQALSEEIEAKRMNVEEQRVIAEEKALEAEAIKDDAEAKVGEYQAELDALDAKAKEKALEEALAAAAARAREIAAAAGQNASGTTDIPANGGVVEYAMSRLGCPYVWGGSGPGGFDCSGLVMWSYAQAGISLPHNSESMYYSASAVIPVSQAEPGDVLYMPGHVGICLSYGGGSYVHAPTSGDVVRVATYPMFTCALRF